MAENPIQRYYLYNKDDWGRCHDPIVVPVHDGDWCRAIDVEKLVAEIERLRAALEWYAEIALTLRLEVAIGIDDHEEARIVKTLAIDGGKRARDALALGSAE